MYHESEVAVLEERIWEINYGVECSRPPDVLESEEYVGEEVNSARR